MVMTGKREPQGFWRNKGKKEFDGMEDRLILRSKETGKTLILANFSIFLNAEKRAQTSAQTALLAAPSVINSVCKGGNYIPETTKLLLCIKFSIIQISFQVNFSFAFSPVKSYCCDKVLVILETVLPPEMLQFCAGS